MSTGYVAAPAETERRRVFARVRGRMSPWRLVVVACAGTLAAGAIGMAALWVATSGTRSASYPIAGPLLGIEIDVGHGDVEILGGGRSNVHVRRTEHYAYDHGPRERLALKDGVLKIRSECASLAIGTCSADYSVAIPDNVSVTIRAAHGDVRLLGYHGSAYVTTTRGGISVDEFCGFVLHATADRGDIDVATACAAEQLELRSERGDVSAVIPPGRYQVDADATGGQATVRGIVAADDAPWRIQALSGSGNVTVEAGS